MKVFLDIVLNGAAVGAVYALVALGFVIIYKATGVINFAQGGFMLVGAYLAFNARVTWGLPFWLAVVICIVGGALVGWLVEATILRFMVGQPVFAQLMVTIGLLFVIQEIVATIWGVDRQDLQAPWGNKVVTVGGATLSQLRLFTIITAVVVMLLFFAFFRYSSLGLAMRATAVDPEAALAQGISARRVYGVAWAISGAVAAIGGVLYAAPPAGLDPTLQFVALLAFPAIVLGGLDSPVGAVVGGLIIGWSQQFASHYMKWGQGFPDVFPYLVMIAVLLVRPSGLFGTEEVRRV
ncbi:MAG TPA: branched-chain amino acid ABC transporter permease [Acidimicrobiales bacterium]|nr:branched-chain amino acid ABC transporter permease [Acidimicrobiales bacterium]